MNSGPLVQTGSELSNSNVLCPSQLDSGRLNAIHTAKPGRPARGIPERSPLTFGKQRCRSQRSYSREFKIGVLQWWFHHRIPQPVTKSNPEGLRAPFLKEVAARYLLPITTLHNWRVNQEKIIASKKGTRKWQTPAHRCRWPELEADLYQKYRKRRDERKAVRRNWLVHQARESYTQCYPRPSRNSPEFNFSNGWLFGFLGRHAITFRFATNKSQKIPENYLHSILSWLRFNRRNSQLRPPSSDEEHTVLVQSHPTIPNGQNPNNIQGIISGQ